MTSAFCLKITHPDYPIIDCPFLLLSIQITAALFLFAAYPISCSPLPYSAGGGPPPSGRARQPAAAAAAAAAGNGEDAGDQYQAYLAYLRNMQSELSKSPNEGPVAVAEVEVPVPSRSPAALGHFRVQAGHAASASRGPLGYVQGMEHELGMSPNQGPVLVRGTRRIKCCDLHCHSVCFSPRRKRSASYVIDTVEQMPRSARISTLYM